MTTYQVNQTLTFGLKVYDAAGALADLGGGLPTATLTKPDGTTTTGSVTKVGGVLGTYLATGAATLPGRWWCDWTGSGQNSGGLPYRDSADVWPADVRLIISLADARAALNLPASAVVDDDEVRLYVAACTDVIESIVGPVLLTERTVTLDRPDGAALLLNEYPEAVSEVVEDGVTLAASTYRLGSGGVLWRRWGEWGESVTVTYTTGWSSIPPSVILAAREEVRYLWQVGQTGQRPSVGSAGGGAGYVTTMPQGFAVPRRVVELLGDSIAANKPMGLA